jgi:hypothetical protein
MIILGDTLTRGERKLVESGKEERVLQLRHDFQMAMRDDLVKVVEATLERKVIAFMSQNHIDPDLAVEVFVLESTLEKTRRLSSPGELSSLWALPSGGRPDGRRSSLFGASRRKLGILRSGRRRHAQGATEAGPPNLVRVTGTEHRTHPCTSPMTV